MALGALLLVVSHLYREEITVVPLTYARDLLLVNSGLSRIWFWGGSRMFLMYLV